MSQTIPFPIIRVGESDPFARGLCHGRMARDQVVASLRTYRRLFKDFVGIEWEDAKRIGLRYARPIGAYAPDLLEEIRGVAEGSGNDLAEILALNSRSEIALSARLVDGCTAFAAFGTATAGGDVLLCQNWDWRASQREAFVVLLIEREDRPAITMLTEAGIIGKIGFNSAGLGACLNAIVTDQVREDGVPLHVVLRRILDSRNLGDAIQAVGAAGIASAANFLIAQDRGGALDIEAVPSDFDVLLPDRDMICHTNHLRSLRLVAVRDLGKMVLPDSYPRLARVVRLLEERHGCLSEAEAYAILRDRDNGPDSICRREDPQDPEGKRLQTVFSVVMNLTRRQLSVTDGPPDAAEYLFLPVASASIEPDAIASPVMA
jgi:isopenicillin-N N-acyltransferase like protein